MCLVRSPIITPLLLFVTPNTFKMGEIFGKRVKRWPPHNLLWFLPQGVNFPSQRTQILLVGSKEELSGGAPKIEDNGPWGRTHLASPSEEVHPKEFLPVSPAKAVNPSPENCGQAPSLMPLRRPFSKPGFKGGTIRETPLPSENTHWEMNTPFWKP